MRKFPIGISDFKRIIRDQYYYVDKSLLIEEVIESNATSILIPRPRRFGKTLNMSMLNAFFSLNKAAVNASLFAKLKVRQTEAWQHQGKHPVIFLSFKDVKETTFEASIEKIESLVKASMKDYRAVLTEEHLDKDDYDYLQQLSNGTLSAAKISEFLKVFSRVLESIYQQKVVILIDEYDSCIIKAWGAGYHEEMVTFMRNFLSGGFKDNDALFKGIITGILRVAKESIFSGLNNLAVFSVLDFEMADKFGITEEEVKQLLEEAGIKTTFDEVKRWYNGYKFGEHSGMYNPWSIINFASKPTEGLKPYWVNTSANELIEELLTNANAELEKKLTGFVNDQPVWCEIDETTIFRDLDGGKEKTVLGLLLFNGYLTYSSKKQRDDGFFEYKLKVPNKEVSMVYTQMLERLLSKSNKVGSSEILAALLEQNAEGFEYFLSQYLMTAFSYHDFNQQSFPERVYHAFVLGLMAHLSNKFIVQSNPESGLGRADLLIYPKDPTDVRGWVLEFKAKKPYQKQSLEEIAHEGMQQIHSSQYITTLKAQSKTQIMLVAAAFDGKEVGCVVEKSDG